MSDSSLVDPSLYIVKNNELSKSFSQDALFYISPSGEFINEGVLSDPENLALTEEESDFEDLNEDLVSYAIDESEEYREWYEIDESDEEELNEFILKYPQIFNVLKKSTGGLLFPEDLEEKIGPEDSTANNSVLDDVILNSNNIGLLPPENFINLDLSESQLKDVEIITKYSSLKLLNLRKNEIRSLESLGQLHNLLYLNVSENELSYFPDILTESPFPLREVDFSKNQISKILKFNWLWALTNVNLSFNRLVTVDNFDHCYFLRMLNLSYNEITEVKNLKCPNLLILLLQANQLEHVNFFEDCPEISYLNISKNKIKDLSGLHSVPKLLHLRCSNNKLNMIQMDHLKPLLLLSHLELKHNPCTEIGYYRLVIIFTVPQIRFLDKKLVLPEEILEARNSFSPSIEKLAFEDHLNSRIEKAAQSSFTIFQDFCNYHPLPSILFLVGSVKSHTEELAMHIREKFQNNVLIGGVHSTATTIERGTHGGNIPISLENFIEMKKKGQLMSTSTILGRLCGFSSTQITKAAERGNVLVCLIPLETAVCLKKWDFKAKVVLIMPSDAPHFYVDEYLEKTRISQKAEVAEEIVAKPRDRKISFFVENKNGGILKNLLGEQREELGEIEQNQLLRVHKKSILKKISFQHELDALLLPHHTSKSSSESEIFDVTNIEENFNEILGEEADENYVSNIGSQGDISGQNELKVKYKRKKVGILSDDENSEQSVEIHGEYFREPQKKHNTIHLFMDSPTFTVTNRLKRIGKLASILLDDSGTELRKPHCIPSELQNLEKIKLSDPGSHNSVDWAKTLLKSNFYNSLITMDEDYYLVLVEDLENPDNSVSKEQIEKFLSPHDYQISFGPSRIYYKKNLESSSETKNHLPLSQLIVIQHKSQKINHDNNGEENYKTTMSLFGCTQELGGENDFGETGPSHHHVLRNGSKNLRKSIEYRGEGEIGGEFDEIMNYDANVNEESNVKKQNIFRHRDAIERAILKTRDSYLNYHFENPGFFTSVIDSSNIQNAKSQLETITKDIIQEAKNKKVSSKNYPLKKSYIDGNKCPQVLEFAQNRLRSLISIDKEWLIGSEPLLSCPITKNTKNVSNAYFERRDCPVDLLTPSRVPIATPKLKLLQLAQEGKYRAIMEEIEKNKLTQLYKEKREREKEMRLEKREKLECECGSNCNCEIGGESSRDKNSIKSNASKHCPPPLSEISHETCLCSEDCECTWECMPKITSSFFESKEEESLDLEYLFYNSHF